MELGIALKVRQYFRDITFIRSSLGLSTGPVLLSLLYDSISNLRVKIIRTSQGKPIGYLAWVSLTAESVKYLRDCNKLPAYPHEWGEGKLSVVYDVCFVRRWEPVARDGAIEYLSGLRYFGRLKNGFYKEYSRGTLLAPRKSLFV